MSQAYFTRWWNQQSPSTQQVVKDLVAQGRLCFVNGGWVQHDEATTHYTDMLLQTTRGHRYVLLVTPSGTEIYS